MSTLITVLPNGYEELLSQEVNGSQLQDLQFIRLPHPRTNVNSLFLPATLTDGTSDILEVQKIAPAASRSWFLEGEVISDGSMVLLTPIDPAFLLVPLLKATCAQDGSLGNFRTLDDILEEAASVLSRNREGITDQTDNISSNDIIGLSSLTCVIAAARRICDFKDVTEDLVVFRYSHSKTMEYLIKKANRLVQGAIIDKSRTLERELIRDGLMGDGKESLLQSGRLKLAVDLISQYISQEDLDELLTKFNFSELNNHVAALEAAQIVQEPSTGKKKPQKPTAQEDSNGKKRKATNQVSKGVEKLKKANVKGMSKISSFFQKKS
ncbi:ribonuclease h2 subunit b [Pyrrhoderma noxium]|uniref:Ribonuclease H2 subunit B n=1 Tax=Pyrrhoderma noxium TaxID=2282107 RepID=A0A286UG14_9AGAM|nr:ribonuclease h2 subunit b [Pyrrhoderma noxium]